MKKIKNLYLETGIYRVRQDASIENTIREALELARKKEIAVQFKFNRIIIRVDQDSKYGATIEHYDRMKKRRKILSKI